MSDLSPQAPCGREDSSEGDGEMSEFRTILRHNIEGSQRSLKAAQQADHPYEVHLHSARLMDLLDCAAENGIDTTGDKQGRVGHRCGELRVMVPLQGCVKVL
jgi:hypothetical protein